MLARFVQSADHLVRQLDSAAAISGRRWPLVSELRVLECQGLDVLAIAAGCGEDGVRVGERAARLLELLEPVVQAHDAGNLEPWQGSREEVRGILAGLRDLLVEPQLEGEVETRAAAVAPPQPAAPTSTPDSPWADVDGEKKGEKVEKVTDAPRPPIVALSHDERRMLAALRENGATSEVDRLKKEDVISFGRMKPHAVRKAAKSLIDKRLVGSFGDRRGGYWLTINGDEVAAAIFGVTEK